MSSKITTSNFGANAFTSDNNLVMNFGHPTVSSYLRVRQVEEWITTLEEVMIMPRMAPHRRHLEEMYFSLKHSLEKHKKEHLQVVTEAPTSDDLMAYLAAYAASANMQ